jgi:hypothetical protein
MADDLHIAEGGGSLAEGEKGIVGVPIMLKIEEWVLFHSL